jgi:hypothetical protein
VNGLGDRPSVVSDGVNGLGDRPSVVSGCVTGSAIDRASSATARTSFAIV